MKVNEIDDLTWYTKKANMPWVICVNQEEQAKEIAEYTDFNVIHIANSNVSSFLKVLIESDKAKNYIYVIGTDLNGDNFPKTKDAAIFQQKLETFFKAYKIIYYTHAMLKDEAIEAEFIKRCQRFYRMAS